MGYILGCMCTYLYVLYSADAVGDRKHSVCVFVVTAVDNGASNVVVSATAVLLAAALGLLISM